jgi:phosphoglycolate phosphatase
VRLIVFDLDGTLVDSRRDLAASANALLLDIGAAPLSEEAIGRMVGDGAAALVARVLAAAGRPEPPGALERFLEIYDTRLLESTRAYPGTSDMLAALRAKAALGVLTNKPLGATRRILDGLDLARFFPAAQVRGGDGPLPRKPDPAGLLQMAADAGAAVAETLLVGDSLVDWRTARAAGARICLARYGFGFEGGAVPDAAPGDLAIDRPADLVALV